MIMHEKFEKD